MNIEEMQQRRCEIEDLIQDRHHEIESLKLEFNTLGSEIERIQQDELDRIVGKSKRA